MAMLTDEEIDAIDQWEANEWDESRFGPMVWAPVAAQAKLANRLRAALVEALNELDELSPGTVQGRWRWRKLAEET